MSRVDKIPFPNLSSLSVSKKRDETSAPISAPTTSDLTTSPTPLTAFHNIENFRFRPYDDSEGPEALRKRRELEQLKFSMITGVYDVDYTSIDDGNNNLARNRKRLEFVTQQLKSFPKPVATFGDYSNPQQLQYYSGEQEKLRTLFQDLSDALTRSIQAEEEREVSQAATASATTNPDPKAVILKIANFKPPQFSHDDNDLFRSKQRELVRLRSDVLGMDGQIDRERIQDRNMHLARTRKKLEYVRRILISFPERMDSEGGGSGNADNARADLISAKQTELRALFEELVLELTRVILAEDRKDAEKKAKAAASSGSKSKEEMDVEEAIAKIQAVEKMTNLKFENELQNEIFKIVGDTLNSVSEAESRSNNLAEATRMKIATVESGMERLNNIEIITYSGLSLSATETRSLADTRRKFVDFMTELVVILNELVDVYASTDPDSRIVRQRTL